MEKIYMEEKQNQNNRKGIFNFSVVLSFAVAIFAVISLASAGIMINQGTGVSYALPTGDSFELIFGEHFVAEGGGSQMEFNTYYAGEKTLEKQVLCIERNAEVDEHKTYVKTTEPRTGVNDIMKNDSGVLYALGLLASGRAKGISGVNNNDALDSFTVQTALWWYLSEKYSTDEVYKLHVGTGVNEGKTDIAVLQSPQIQIRVDSNDPVAFNTQKIVDLKNALSTATKPSVTVTKESDEISKTEDGKFYQSALITVVGNPTAGYMNYNIQVSGIEGAVIVDQNGQTIETTPASDGSFVHAENIDVGKKFYVRIPADKVTKEVQKVNIGVTGNFIALDGFYYKRSDGDVVDGAKVQRLASAGPGEVGSQIEVEFIGSDDTGMKAVQTIYFIGLIVLLCGVGIVYANAKPVEVK